MMKQVAIIACICLLAVISRADWRSAFDDAYFAPAAEVSEGNDAYTKLLLHCDGTNGSTVVADSSADTKTISVYGSAQLSTEQKQFGTASLLLNGSTDYLTIPASADFNFGTGAFTIDFWMRFSTIEFYALTMPVTYRCGDVSAFEFAWDNRDNHMYINIINSWPTTSLGGHVVFPFAAGEWYHVALVRIDGEDSADSWRWFINGTNLTATLDQGAWSSSMPDVVNYFAIGRDGDYGAWYFPGWIDEFRVSKGFARWTNNFTPPIRSYGE